MYKYILIICIIYLNLPVYSTDLNMINNTNFINKGYFSYDINSFKKDTSKQLYYIDIMEELDPGGDVEDINCPYGIGKITHLIYSTVYAPKQKKFNAKYKGFACSIMVIEYDNNKPLYIYYNTKGIYYDKKVSLFGKYQRFINTDSLSYISKDVKHNKNNDYIEFINGLIKEN